MQWISIRSVVRVYYLNLFAYVVLNVLKSLHNIQTQLQETRKLKVLKIIFNNIQIYFSKTLWKYHLFTTILNLYILKCCVRTKKKFNTWLIATWSYS